MKKAALIVVAATVLIAATVFASSRVFAASRPSSAPASSAATASPCPHDVALYGHVRSLTPKGDHFELQFDPAWFLSGLTASRASLEDGGPSAVPNDNVVVDEGHRVFTYLLPAAAEITVLSRTGELPGAGFPSTAITAPELAQLITGDEPVKLAEPLDTGFWMHVNIDTVCSLHQQYQP